MRVPQNHAAARRAVAKPGAQQAVLARLEQATRLEEENRQLRSEVEQRRQAEQLALRQSAVLLQSMEALAGGADLDTCLGQVLKATVDHLGALGGTLWFPDRASGRALLHMEYLDGRVIPARASRHPAVLQPPRIGGLPFSTFPAASAERYLLAYEVCGLPEQSRAYIMSLGVRALLTVPMTLGGEPLGWICIRTDGPDARGTAAQVRMAEVLAGQAALAIQMARLSQRARDAAVLEERNRIAREIHDTLAQSFTGVLVNLQACTRALARSDEQLAVAHVGHARDLAVAGLQEARNSVRTLRPHAREAPCLSAQLGLLAQTIQETGMIEARFSQRGEPRPLDPAHVMEVLRIAQESTTNVLKHARAGAVHIELVYGAQELLLRVSDDGRGFEPGGEQDGFGLLGMQERAQRVGSRLSIHSAPGAGTCICIGVPYAAHG